MANERQMAVWRAVGSLTFSETLELAETFRDAWENVTEFEASDVADWSFLLNTAREIAEDRDSDRNREADETGTGSVGEADRARAEGIAQPFPPHPKDSSPCP